MAEENGQTEQARLAKVETQVAHAISAVGNLSGVIEKGFDETRKLISEIEKRSDERVGRLHERFDEHQRESALRHAVNPGLVVAIIVASIAVGGVFVQFINMSILPIGRRHERDVEWMEKINSMRFEHLKELHERDLTSQPKPTGESR